MPDNSKLIADLKQIGSAVAAGGRDLTTLNEARDRGNTLATENQVLMDRDRMTPVDFLNTYGPEAATLLNSVDQNRVAVGNYMAGATRTNGQAGADTLIDIGKGFGQSLGSIGVLGAAVVNRDLGIEANQLLNTAGSAAREFSSPYIRRNENIEAIRANLDNQDNQKQYEIDKQTDGKLMADLKHVGRDFLDAGYRTLSNPAALNSVVDQGVGSLLAAGPVTKVLSKVGMAAQAAVPVSIGLMEGGGAYGSTVTDIMSKSDEELKASSPEYNSLLEYMDPETAKRTIAHRAGLVSAAIQGPAAAAIGKVAGIAEFEAAPFARRTIGQVVGNLGKETVEEGLQSASGQISQNLATSFEADPNQDIFAGVGEQTALGAIGGLGSAGVVQAPGAALRTAVKAAGIPIKAVVRRSQEQLAANAASSTVSPEKLGPVVQQATEQAAGVAEGMRTIVAEQGVDPAQIDTYVSRIQKASEVPTEELLTLPDSVLDVVGGYAEAQGRDLDRFETMLALAKVASNEDASPEDRTSAATFILKSIETNKKLFDEDLPNLLNTIPNDRDEFKHYKDYASALASMGETPAVIQAMEWASEKMAQPETDISQMDLSSPEGQRLVSQTVDIATVAPQAINETVANGILNQADEGTLQMSSEQRRTIRAALALLNAERVAQVNSRVMEPGLVNDQVNELQSELDQTAPLDDRMTFVNRQIKIDGGKAGHQLSLARHASGINLALRQGDTKSAKERVEYLGKFAVSQINKLAAMNESIRRGDKKNISYKSFDGTTFFENKKGIGYNSERLARTIYDEANAIAGLLNSYVRDNPELGLKELKVPDLLLDQGDPAATPSIVEPRATTSRVENEVSAESPLPPSQPASEPADTNPVEEQVRVEGSTDKVENIKPSVSEDRIRKWSDDALNSNFSRLMDRATVQKLKPAENETLRLMDEEITRRDAKKAPVAEPVVEPEASTQDIAEVVSQAVEEALTAREETAPKFENVPAQEADQAVIDQVMATEDGPGTFTLEEAFPNLVQPAGRNFFQKAFSFPATIRSRLINLSSPTVDGQNLQSPINRISWLMQNPREIVQMIGRPLAYTPDVNARRNHYQLMKQAEKAVKHIDERVDAALNKPAIKTGTETRLDVLESGKEWVIRTRDLRALNLLERVNGKYQLNRELLETAVIAGMDWLLNANERNVKLDVDEVARIMGVEPDLVTDEIVMEFNNGLSMNDAKRAVADNILKFWGVTANADVRQAFTIGIPEAIAAEVLHGLQDVGLLSLYVGKDNRISFPGVTDKKFGRVRFNERSDKANEFIKSLNDTHELLSDLALVDKETAGYSIGKPVEEIDETHLRDPMTRTTADQKTVLANVQNTPYLPNTIVFDFIQAMDEEAFVTLMSGRPYTKGDLKKTHKEMKLNKAHWKSVQGLQRQLASSYQNVTKQMEAVRNHAKTAGVPVDQMPSYFKHHINRLGRLQMAGLSNPQADKLAREIFMATKSTLDLTDPAQMDKFLMTVGQGIGLKTEQETRDVIVQKVRARALSPHMEAGMDPKDYLYPLVQAAKEWIQERDAGRGQDMKGELFNLMNEREKKLSMHGIHSILALARYELTRESGGALNKFETFNYLEADGKTNGPINALMLFSAGAITADWLNSVAKGGAFFGSKTATLNTPMFNDSKTNDKIDLYKAGALGTSKRMKDLGDTIRKSHKASGEIFDTFVKVLTAMNADVTLDADGNIVIDRGVTKNPLTITIYGSGTNGIAGNISDELVKGFYEMLSELVQDNKEISPELIENLTTLTSKTVLKNKEGKYYIQDNGTVVGGTSAMDFEMSPAQKKALRSNIKTFLVEPMREAISDTVTKHTSPVTTVIQQATQYQSIILKNMFLKEIARRIALYKSDPEKYEYVGSEFLSTKELNQIRDSLKKYAPVVSTGSQSYFFSGGEKSDLFNITRPDANGEDKAVPIEIDGQKVTYPEGFSGSLSEDMRTPAFTSGYSLAGVSAIPTSTIGSGDGQMMLNALLDPATAARVLHVFDGLNMPADMINEYSQNINKAVFETWTSNKNFVRSMAESFAEFMRNDPIEEMFAGGLKSVFEDQASLEIAQTFEGTFDKNVQRMSVESMKATLLGVLSNLENVADETDVRRQLYKEFDVAIDQMASAENPHVNEGTIKLEPGITREQVAEAMEVRRMELMDELRKSRKETTPVEKGSLHNVIGEFGLVDDSGAQVLNVNDMELLSRFTKDSMSSTQNEMMVNALALLKDAGWTFVFGSSAELNAWEQTYNGDRYQPGSNYHLGKTDPAIKTVMISNISTETMVHELVHAAVMDKVRAYYANPKLLTEAEFEAVKRTELLMNEWMAINTEYDNAAGQEAHGLALSVVTKLKDAGNQADAVNEFMAWVLGNQHLAEQAERTKVINPLARIVGDVLKALKKLIWGGENKGPKVGDSILSNLRFNTRVLMAQPTQADTARSEFNRLALFQSRSFGSSDRLTAIRERINNKITAYMDGTSDPESVALKDTRRREMTAVKQAAEDVLNIFSFHFHDLGNMQAKSTFHAIQTILMTELELNSNALVRMQELFDYVMSNISPTDLRENDNPNDLQDITWAQEKLKALEGTYGVTTDAMGRGSHLSAFIALAMTSDQFRNVLSKVRKPKSEKNKAGTMDAVLENAANSFMDSLSVKMAGEQGGSMADAMDSLVYSMLENTADQRSHIEQRIEGGLNGLEDRFTTWLQDGSEKLIQSTQTTIQTSNSKLTRAGARVANFAAHMINEKSASQVAMGLVSLMNRQKGFDPLKALVKDLVGRTEDNKLVWDMVSKVRSFVDQTRQQFREELPKTLNDKFTRAVSQAEWTAMFNTIGKTDFAHLVNTYGIASSLEFIKNPQRRATEIQNLENQVRADDRRRANFLIDKSKQLGRFMVHGEAGTLLLSNAEAIATGLGHPGMVVTPSAQLVSTIDKLASLHALDAVMQEDHAMVADLIQNELVGVDYVAHYLVGQRVDEMAKVNSSPEARLNHYKGNIPSLAQQGGSLVIADEKDAADYLARGYKRIRAYGGSQADTYAGNKTYFFAAVSGKAPFRQGIMQTVHQTASGVDPASGYTMGEVMAGRITDPRAIRNIMRNATLNSLSNEELRPVFNTNGEIIALERLADPMMLKSLNRSTDLAKMIGVWRGRQAEELLAQEVNKQHVENLHKMWTDGVQKRRQREFINIADLPKGSDPVLVDAVKLIPREAWEEAERLFGRDQFWVRNDAIDNALGFRQASVGDLFTGLNRMNPKISKKFEQIAIGMFGNKAFPTFVSIEKNVQEVVGNAKQMIVVKSVIVPAANMIANMYQLLNRRVPLRSIISGVGAKTVEINTYIKGRNKVIRLEADLRAAKGQNDLVKIAQLERSLRSLKDSFRRMSIWPLIEGGQFSAISNGDVTAEDLALADGQWSDWVARKLASLPAVIGTPARYFMVSKDTALYQGLARSVQYGDFIAKAILYDHLKNTEPKTDAIPEVAKTFVDYNLSAGRTRQYLESAGLLWFYSFKLRSVKEAVYMLRHNPLRSLIMAGLPTMPLIGDVGSPLSDNVVSLGMDGKLEWSIGPNMGLHSFNLNPWVNLVD